MFWLLYAGGAANCQWAIISSACSATWPPVPSCAEDNRTTDGLVIVGVNTRTVLMEQYADNSLGLWRQFKHCSLLTHLRVISMNLSTYGTLLPALWAPCLRFLWIWEREAPLLKGKRREKSITISRHNRTFYDWEKVGFAGSEETEAWTNRWTDVRAHTEHYSCSGMPPKWIHMCKCHQ